MAMFGDLLVKLDPWQVDYGAELPFEDVAEGADDAIAALDPATEVPGTPYSMTPGFWVQELQSV